MGISAFCYEEKEVFQDAWVGIEPLIERLVKTVGNTIRLAKLSRDRTFQSFARQRAGKSYLSHLLAA